MLFRKTFFFKIVPFKNARKTQNLGILRGKLNQNGTFCVQKLFQNLLLKTNFFIKIVIFRKNFFFKITFFKNIFFFKIWRIVKILFQDLMLCKNFVLVTDAL